MLYLITLILSAIVLISDYRENKKAKTNNFVISALTIPLTIAILVSL